MRAHKIWVIDRSTLFRAGLKMLLHPTFEVISEAAEITLIKEIDANDRPALILVSVYTALLPGSDEAQGLAQLCRIVAPVVVLSAEMSVTQLRHVMKSGASGYLLRDIAPDALLQSLMVVIAGEKVLPTDLVEILLDGGELGLFDNFDAVAAPLSPRETRILECLAHGYPNKVIAHELEIAEGTVKVHLKAVFRKVGARNRTEAAIWARNHGFDSHLEPLKVRE